MKLKFKEAPREWRKAAWLSLLGLALLSSVLRWRRVLPGWAWVAVLAVALALALLAGLRPAWFRGYYRVSTRIGYWLSEALARVILSLIFVFLLVPLGLVLRLLGKDPLRLRRTRPVETYWSNARPTSPLDRLF